MRRRFGKLSSNRPEVLEALPADRLAPCLNKIRLYEDVKIASFTILSLGALAKLDSLLKNQNLHVRVILCQTTIYH